MTTIECKSLDFYRRVIFGSNYDAAQVKNQNIEIVMNWCFNNAWGDMARHTLNWNGVFDNEKPRIKRDIFNNIFIL